MVLGATNWVFNIVALNPLFISFHWDEKFVDLVEQIDIKGVDGGWARLYLTYTEVCSVKRALFCVLEWKVVDFV